MEIIGFPDSFNFEKMYSDSSFFNVFGFGGPKIKRIRIRRDIDISQKMSLETLTRVDVDLQSTLDARKLIFCEHCRKITNSGI